MAYDLEITHRYKPEEPVPIRRCGQCGCVLRRGNLSDRCALHRGTSGSQFMMTGAGNIMPRGHCVTGGPELNFSKLAQSL